PHAHRPAPAPQGRAPPPAPPPTTPAPSTATTVLSFQFTGNGGSPASPRHSLVESRGASLFVIVARRQILPLSFSWTTQAPLSVATMAAAFFGTPQLRHSKLMRIELSHGSTIRPN